MLNFKNLISCSSL